MLKLIKEKRYMNSFKIQNNDNIINKNEKKEMKKEINNFNENEKDFNEKNNEIKNKIINEDIEKQNYIYQKRFINKDNKNTENLKLNKKIEKIKNCEKEYRIILKNLDSIFFKYIIEEINDLNKQNKYI